MPFYPYRIHPYLTLLIKQEISPFISNFIHGVFFVDFTILSKRFKRQNFKVDKTVSQKKVDTTGSHVSLLVNSQSKYFLVFRGVLCCPQIGPSWQLKP